MSIASVFSTGVEPASTGTAVPSLMVQPYYDGAKQIMRFPQEGPRRRTASARSNFVSPLDLAYERT